MSITLPGPVAFAMGGGASLGAAQVGMLRALGEAGVRADLVVGTSVGALNGAFVAADPDGGAARLARIWPTLRSADVFPGRPWQHLRTLERSRTHLIESSGLEDIIRNHLPTGDIEELALPFGAVACDVEKAATSVLTSGPLDSALLASAAIPGLFPAVERDGRMYYDGGVLNTVPILQAQQMGAGSVVVLDCGMGGLHPARPSTISEIMLWALDVMARQQPLLDATTASAVLPVLYLPVQTEINVNPLELASSIPLMELSHGLSRDLLASLAGTDLSVPGLYGSLRGLHTTRT